MVEFPANPDRKNPYLNSKFILIDATSGQPVLGVSKVSGGDRKINVVKHRAGSDPSITILSPGGPVEYSPITLERGFSQDTTFEELTNSVWKYGSNLGSEVSLKAYRRNFILELLDEAGHIVKAWKLYRCWVSDSKVFPDVDANASAVAIERVTLQVEAIERDDSVPEPIE